MKKELIFFSVTVPCIKVDMMLFYTHYNFICIYLHENEPAAD